MSTQNFVSYGDAETLMSGIAEKISGGGGGGTVELYNFKNDTSITSSSNGRVLAQNVLNAIQTLTNKQLSSLRLLTRSKTNDNIWIMGVSYVDNYNNTYTIQFTNNISTSNFCRFGKSMYGITECIYYGNDIMSSTISSNVDEFILYYNN